MSGTQIGGLAIAIIDREGNLIARHARGVNHKMSVFLNDAERKVAAECGLSESEVIKIRAHGKGGLAGIALFADSGLPAAPYPPARKLPGNTGLNPGRLDDELVTTIIEPTDSDREHPRQSLYDPAAGDETGMSVRYPNGETSISKRKKKNYE